jgi:photosystem II stability/assembly factor-like uncharacterized protein
MRNLRPSFRLVALGACVVAQVALAPSSAVARWLWIGPDGGSVLALAFDPSLPGTVYAGTEFAGVWKSSDGGVSWSMTGPGLPRFGVLSLAVAGRSPSTVYAGTHGAGVFVSVNGGATWSPANAGLPGFFTVYGITVGAEASATIYAYGVETIFSGNSLANYSRAFKTVDGGATWTAADQGLTDHIAVTALAADPTSPGRVFAAGSGGLGIWRSLDGGATWNAVGHPDLPDDTFVVRFAFSPAGSSGSANGATLYAATNRSGVFASADGGLSWQATGLTPPMLDLVADPSSPGVLYASGGTPGAPPIGFSAIIYKSFDGGVSWQQSAAGIPGSTGILALDPSHPATLLATLYSVNLSGIARSTDAASSWAVSDHGLRALPAEHVASDPLRPGTLYVTASAGGLWKTRNRGKTWRFLRGGLFGAVVFDPRHTTTLFASIDGRLSRSLDGGVSWLPIDQGLPPQAGLGAYAIGPPGDTLWVLTPQGLFKSADGGASWSGTGQQLEFSVSFAAAPDGNLYVAVRLPWFLPPPHAIVLRSADGGATFTTASTGIADDTLFFELAADPLGSALYIGTDRGVYESTNQGASWTLVPLPVPFSDPNNPDWVQTVLPDPRIPGTVYAGTHYSGAYRSTDGGLTWVPLGNSLGLLVSGLAVDPSFPSNVYAASEGGLLRYRPGR